MVVRCTFNPRDSFNVRVFARNSVTGREFSDGFGVIFVPAGQNSNGLEFCALFPCLLLLGGGRRVAKGSKKGAARVARGAD